MHNPLEKLPVLILEDGSSVYESHYILEYIEAKFPGTPLLSENIDERLLAKKIEVVADGICDALVLLFFEKQRKDQSSEWKGRQMRKVDGGFKALAEWVDNKEFIIGGKFGLQMSRPGAFAVTSTCAFWNTHGDRGIHLCPSTWIS